MQFWDFSKVVEEKVEFRNKNRYLTTLDGSLPKFSGTKASVSLFIRGGLAAI
jgi:hypothetical protein